MKWIIRIQITKGGPFWAVSQHDGSFALVQIEPSGVVRNALAWESRDEVIGFIRETKKHPMGKKFFTDFEPEIVLCAVPQ